MSNEDIARLLEAIKDWNGVARDEFASQIDDAVKSLRRPTQDAPDLVDAFAESELSNDELDPLFDVI